MRALLQEVISEMVAKGIYWSEAIAEFEKLFVLEGLQRHKGNLSKAAEAIGMHRNTLSKKMKEFNIEKEPKRSALGRSPTIKCIV